MFKKSIVYMVVFFLVLGFALTGCSSKPEPAKEPEEGDQGFTIGFSNFSIENSWRVSMEEEFKAYAEQLKAEGIIDEVILTNSNGDISKQIADVRDLITKNVDAIVITAASPSALAPVCEEAIDKGIVVISFDNYVDSDKVTSKVGIDEIEFGRVNAQFLVDQLGGKGKIVVLNGIAGSAVDALRYQGAEGVFAQYPEIEIIGDAYAGWDYAQGKAATDNFLAAHPQIDGVWSQGGAMTQGALDAFIAAGRPLVPMSGEANNGLLKAWLANKDNGFSSIAPCCPTYVSATALEVAIDALQGKEVPKQVNLDLPVVTEENLEEFVKPDLPDSFWNITKLSEEKVKELFSR